jgi:hypothetical protein
LSLVFICWLSCVGRGLCNGLVTRSKESYCVSNSKIKKPQKEEAKARFWAVGPLNGTKYIYSIGLSLSLYVYIYIYIYIYTRIYIYNRFMD